MQNLLKDKKYLFVALIIISVGIISGIIYYNLLEVNTKESISYLLTSYENFRYNSIIKDLIITSLLLVTSLFIIGLPLSIFYLFYESLSLGFLLSIFFINFKISGIIYTLLYFLVNKLLLFILIILFIPKLFNITRFIIGLFIYKKDNYYVDRIVSNFKNSIYIIIFILVNNIVLYFLSPIIFSKLTFLLK